MKILSSYLINILCFVVYSYSLKNNNDRPKILTKSMNEFDSRVIFIIN